MFMGKGQENPMAAANTINGKFAKITMDRVHPITRESIRRTIMGARNITATGDFTKQSLPIIGRKANSHKITDLNWTGTLGAYWGTRAFLEYMNTYRNDGVFPEVAIFIYQEDPQTSLGPYSCKLLGVQFDSIQVANVDIEATSLQYDMPFTFEDWEPGELFKELDPGKYGEDDYL